MKPFPSRLATLLLVLGAAVVAVWIISGKQPASSSAGAGKNQARQTTRTTTPDPLREREITDQTARRRIEADWAALLEWLRSEPRPDPEEVRKRLLEIRLEWTAMDPQIRAEIIAVLLASGDDAPTGLDFKVGNHGQLAGWPTLRIFLLDILATADPEMAPAIARRVLDSTDSADEYATALRSLTRANAGRAENSELLDRFDHMLAREPWQKTRAFAEALDLARFIGTPEAARRLVDLQGNPALKFVALDEFAAEHPAAIHEMLKTQGTALDSAARTSLMARMDPLDADQLAAVDSYLRDPARTPDEITGFLKIYPLRSATTGFRLYGKTPSPYTFERVVAGDQMAQSQVAQWLADPALASYHAQLAALNQRLGKWKEDAE